MTTPESPEEPDLSFTPSEWAFSFLTDWIIPLLHDDQIDTPREILELHERFIDKATGRDFTIADVLEEALRWRAHNRQHFPDIRDEAHPDGEALGQAIDLLFDAAQPLQSSFDWSLLDFLDSDDDLDEYLDE